MYVKVIVSAGANKEKIINKHKQVYEIHTKEPALRNLANQRVRELLAEIYSINRGKIRLISGHHSRSKIFDLNLES